MTAEVGSAELLTGVTLQYVRQGDSSGVAVLLVHGLGDSWRSFEQVLPHLPESICTYALTQRGHGDSGRPAAGYATRDFAKIPNARLVVYPGTGHGLHWEEPERFASDLVAFIQAASG